MEQAIRSSQIVVLGVPSKEYKVPVEWLQDNAIVINVASYKNVDEEKLLAEKPNVKYIPQIGRVTVSGQGRVSLGSIRRPADGRGRVVVIGDCVHSSPSHLKVAMLERNLLRLYENFHSESARLNDATAAQGGRSKVNLGGSAAPAAASPAMTAAMCKFEAEGFQILSAFILCPASTLCPDQNLAARRCSLTPIPPSLGHSIGRRGACGRRSGRYDRRVVGLAAQPLVRGGVDPREQKKVHRIHY